MIFLKYFLLTVFCVKIEADIVTCMFINLFPLQDCETAWYNERQMEFAAI